MKIISISGLDGSGKSTQIQLLKKHFENDGKKVFYFHAVSFSVANILNSSTDHDAPATPASRDTLQCVSAHKNKTRASKLGILLRKIALFVDVHRFKFLVKKLKKQNYDYILTDRYFYDMIINIAYLSKKKYVPFFLQKITVPDYKFFLQTDPQNIMKRERVPLQGLEYLKDKDKLFKDYNKIFNLTVVNGNKQKQEVFSIILSTFDF